MVFTPRPRRRASNVPAIIWIGFDIIHPGVVDSLGFPSRPPSLALRNDRSRRSRSRCAILSRVQSTRRPRDETKPSASNRSRFIVSRRARIPSSSRISQCENLDREFGAKKRTSDIIFLLVGVGVRAIVAARDAMPISAIRRLFSSMRAARAASNAFVSVVMRAFASSFVVE